MGCYPERYWYHDRPGWPDMAIDRGGSSEVLEVGYLFNRSYWGGKGYAIEAARACKEYAFSTLNSREVYSIIRDCNVASMNVAIRNGMLARGSFIKHYRGLDMQHLVFSAKREPSIT